jgi:glycosyltransferase involved in cell wall biosynthesis
LSAKKTILILSDWFLPGCLAGGPIQSVATLTKHLEAEFDFKIITTDRDFKANEPYKTITPDCWTNYEGRSVFYISQNNLTPEFVLNVIQTTAHDVIYLNSLFSKHFAVNPLKWKQQGKIKAPIILVPRGMFGNSALLVKPLKKKLFFIYTKLFGLFKNIHWQSTSPQETLDIKKHIGSSVKLTEITNLPHTPEAITIIEKKSGELKLCFIARILGIKNLDVAIDVLKNITKYPVTFDIYGPKEDIEYWNLCETNIKTLPANITCTYKGVLQPTEIGKTLSAYHALLLPTQTENFGHVIVETFLQGRPVIISDNTPWRGLEAKQVGFDVSLTHKEKFTEVIQQLIQLDNEGFQAMSKNCISYINTQLNIEDIKAKYIRLFNQP